MNIQTLFQHAKEDMLREGQHAPILYVEYTDAAGKDSLALYYFAEFGAQTPREEHMHLFSLGMQFGQEQGRVDFTCLTFIAEAWVSSLKPGERRTWKRPADDPNRKEALMALIVEVQPTPGGKPTLKQSFLQAEIVRVGETIDLLTRDTSDMEITQMLFPTYFLSGYSASHVTQSQLAEVMRKLRR